MNRIGITTILFTAAVTLLTGGCGGGGSAPDEGEDERLPAPPEVSAALLSTDDLTGYDRIEPDRDATPPDGSDRPRCLRALNDLDYGTPASGSAVQARREFGHSKLGPWLRETLRVYPDDSAAEKAYEKAVSGLSDCELFTVTWSDLAATGTERVRETTNPGLDDRSWAANIRVDLDGYPSGETKTLVQKGRVLVVLSHAAAPDAPAQDETRNITGLATERAFRVLDT
ncbi:hypothetical protein [Streptomyces graminofaciens]|nr:hypothetical protein [Streptomyces graminofaciens]